MGAPQIIWICLICTGLGLHLAHHGKPKLEKWNFWRNLFFSIVVAVLLWWGGFFGNQACAADVPTTALRLRGDLIRTGHAAWGLDAPTATFAAQIHTESQWRPNATSPVGATGMAQFMPTTADWISRLDPELAANQPTNPAWAMRALVTYDKWLFNRIQASDDCQRMAFALSAYNGGLGWIQRDKKAAKAAGAESLTWFGEVERFNAGRNQAAFRENRAYPRLILKVREPVYAARGFGKGACNE